MEKIWSWVKTNVTHKKVNASHNNKCYICQMLQITDEKYSRKFIPDCSQPKAENKSHTLLMVLTVLRMFEFTFFNCLDLLPGAGAGSFNQ